VVLGAIVVGSILISRKRARMPANARESISKMKAEKGVQFCINCGAELPGDSRFCNKCGSAQS
jgi:ribosomal protein L40E